MTLPDSILAIVKLARNLYQICPINFPELEGAFNALERYDCR